MSLFALVRGLTQGMGDYVQQQRQRARDLEDQDFNFRMRQLESEANRPDFNPEHYEQLMGEMANLSQQRAGQPLKKGKAGFLGQREPLASGPIAQLLRGAATGNPNGQIPSGHIGNIPVQVTTGGQTLKSGQPPAGTGQSSPAAAPAPTSSDGSVAPGGAPPSSAAAGGAAPQVGATLTPPPGMQPQPESSLPQPAGGAAMLQAANSTAQEAQNPVPAAGPVAAQPGAAGLTAPPGFKPPFSQEDIGPAAYGGGLRFSPEQMEMRAANQGAMKQYGDVRGRIAAAGAAFPGGQVPQDVAMRIAFPGMPIESFQTKNAMVNGKSTLVEVGNHGTIRDAQTKGPLQAGSDIRLEGIQSPFTIFHVTAPDGSVQSFAQNRYDPTQPVTGQQVAGPNTGRVQFAPPPINVGESQDAGGNITRSYVGRERVAGPAAAGGPAGAPKAGTNAPKSGTGMTPPPGSDTGTSVERGKGGSMTVRRAPVAKFSDQQKSALGGIDSAARFARNAMAFIEQNGLKDNNNPIDSRWNNFLYSAGIDPGKTEELIQNVGIAEPKAIIGQMGGQRGQYWGELLARHTAQASNTYALMYKKLANMINIGAGIKQDINTAAMAVPTPGGPRTPSLRQPPSSGSTVQMRAPDGTVKPIPADQVEHYKSKGAVVVGAGGGRERGPGQ